VNFFDALDTTFGGYLPGGPTPEEVSYKDTFLAPITGTASAVVLGTLGAGGSIIHGAATGNWDMLGLQYPSAFDFGRGIFPEDQPRVQAYKASEVPGGHGPVNPFADLGAIFGKAASGVTQGAGDALAAFLGASGLGPVAILAGVGVGGYLLLKGD
jgi:hypothetical protein